jgi:hypothetical protein
MYAKENSANVWVDDQLPDIQSFNVGVNLGSSNHKIFTENIL